MPNCRKSAGKFDSTLTNELAYLIGVYLGDGCICFAKNNNNYFSLNAIDKEFVERTRNCLEKVLGKKIPIFLDNWGAINRGRAPLWKVVAYGKTFGQWLREISHHKNKIPSLIKEANREQQKWFIAGIMDSEGYVSVTKRKNGNRRGSRVAMIGICCADKWLDDFVKMLQQHGVKVGGKREEQRIRPFHRKRYRYGLNIKSWLRSGCFFTIKRKIQKLEEYKTLRDCMLNV
ncbi:MAG: hypothetical protein FJ044_01265 [Candidatus Cloacimonetes bacterium]|nr:hypothetical protein [Candidatus Cloacimonadota bacterium]